MGLSRVAQKVAQLLKVGFYGERLAVYFRTVLTRERANFSSHYASNV